MDLTKLSQNFNEMYEELFNNILIDKNSEHKFGSNNQTVSEVLGRNQQQESLSTMGLMLVKLLDLFEPNHAVNSIKNK